VKAVLWVLEYSSLWWEGFVQQASFEPEWKSKFIMDGKRCDNENELACEMRQM